MTRIRLESLRDDLPQGVWQDEQGALYSVDGRAGSYPVMNGRVYHRRDECVLCGGWSIVSWLVDREGGTEVTTCLEACGAPDADINKGEPF